MHNNNYNEETDGESKDTRWHPNRAYIQLAHGIVIDSCFPGGNVADAVVTCNSPLTIELEGNTDISFDNSAKYWLYFHIRGFRKDRPIKLVLRNANHLRKFYGQPRYRPFLVYRQGDDEWRAMATPLEMTILQTGQLQASCTFLSQKPARDRKANKSTNDLYLGREEKMTPTTVSQDSSLGNCYFAIYYPYSYEDLNAFLLSTRMKFENSEPNRQTPQNRAYFHDETIAYTFEHRKVSLITITSFSNVESFSEREPVISDQIFPHTKDRPFKLKNNPVVLFTARVHPSQTSSSFFIEGVIQFLLGDSRAAAILRQMFIFQIIPMLNPDGVEHGNFRFDHEMRNLNRYYGQSSIQKTPSIRAAELLIDYYKNINSQSEFGQQSYCRLLMYTDVHGHSSALPSFIYGNHTEKLQHAIQNRMFCKLLESNFVGSGFSRGECQFSKKNMSMQQKYDQFSKLCSGRVFAGRMDKPELSIFHSYTMEILPFWEVYPRRKLEQKTEKINSPEYARLLGKTFLVSILDLLDLNPQSKFSEPEMDKMRKQVTKQCLQEQSRRLLLFKKVEGAVQRPSYSELGKTKPADRQCLFYSEYIRRWFSHQTVLNNLLSNQTLLKESKFTKFYLKIGKLLQIPLPNSIRSPLRKAQRIQGMKLCESEHKHEAPLTHSRIRLTHEKSQTSIIKQQKIFSSDERILFVCRSNKDKPTVEAKVSKKTIELQSEFVNYASRQKKTIKRELTRNNPDRRDPQYRRNILRCHTNSESTDRYEQEILLKINTNSKHNPLLKTPVFQIKAKEMVTRERHINRIQTETIASEPTHNDSPHEKLNPLQSSHCLKATIANREISLSSKEVESPARHRPSFIEQFMMKIRAERQSLNINLHKNCNRDQLKIRSYKLSSSGKKHAEEEEKNMALPVLRKNKIFTVAKESTMSPDYMQSRGYESITQHRKRMLTEQQFHLDEVIMKTKDMVTAHKKQEIIRDQINKKSQRTSEYKYG